MSDWEDLTPKADGGWEELSPAPTSRRGRFDGAVDAIGRARFGMNEAAAQMASGAVAAPIAGLAGIAGAVLPGEAGQGARWTQNVQHALTYEPRTPAGQKAAGIVNYIPEKIAEGADWAGGKVTDAATAIGATPEQAATFGAEANTAIQALPALVGKAVNPIARRKLLLDQTRQEIAAKANAAKDKVLNDAQDAGLGISPAEANPSLLNRVLEGLGGQAKTQLLQSDKNKPVVNQIARKALGIADDVPLSMDTLAEVRRNAGQSYEKVRNVGEVTIDADYRAALDRIEEKYKGASKSFKDEASDVEKAVNSARNTVEEGKFDSSAAVDKIKIERARADKSFKEGDTELGKAHKAIADAIEEQIDRHLEKLDPNTDWGEIANFRKARQIIARSYDVQKALKGGDVDARVLAAQLKKGRPVGGGLEVPARAAEQFKGSFQVGGKNAYVGPTYFDAAAGAAGGISELANSGSKVAAAIATLGLTAARPAIRSAITSRMYQNSAAVPEYNPSAFRRLSEAATSDPSLAFMASLQSQQQERRGR